MIGFLHSYFEIFYIFSSFSKFVSKVSYSKIKNIYCYWPNPREGGTQKAEPKGAEPKGVGLPPLCGFQRCGASAVWLRTKAEAPHLWVPHLWVPPFGFRTFESNMPTPKNDDNKTNQLINLLIKLSAN